MEQTNGEVIPFEEISKNFNPNKTIYELRKNDVLFGRGNGICNLPGNRSFRDLVDARAKTYIKAERAGKKLIARQIVELVYASGGRFLKYENDNVDDVFQEVRPEKAAEKAQQAFRDSKDFPTSSSPRKSEKRAAVDKPKASPNSTSSPNPPKNSSIIHSQPRQEDKSNDREVKDSSSEHLAPTTSSNKKRSSRGGNSSSRKRIKTFQNNPGEPPAPTHRLMMQFQNPESFPGNGLGGESGWFCDTLTGSRADSSWEELFVSLVSFKEQHGHCAIPPSDGSGKDKDLERLADWASVQRQLFREVQQGYRLASDTEAFRFKRLQALGFVWNYEEWHWERQYQELLNFQRMEEELKNKKNGPSALGKDGELDAGKRATGPRGRDAPNNAMAANFKVLELALWVKQQRQLYMDGLMGKIQPMRRDRVEKLESITFSWATNIYGR